jgi:hypothetical protein
MYMIFSRDPMPENSFHPGAACTGGRRMRPCCVKYHNLPPINAVPETFYPAARTGAGYMAGRLRGWLAEGVTDAISDGKGPSSSRPGTPPPHPPQHTHPCDVAKRTNGLVLEPFLGFYSQSAISPEAPLRAKY